MDVRLPGPLNPLMLRPSEHGDRKSHRGGVIPDPRSDLREEYERSRRGFSGTSVNFTSPAPARARGTAAPHKGKSFGIRTHSVVRADTINFGTAYFKIVV
jgi:hypothetical protein